jgi:hypothetical protein
MFARDGDTVRVDHIRFDAERTQRTGQPKAVAPRLKGDRDPVDGAAGRLCLFAPTMQQPQQPRLVWFELLCRVSLDPNPPNQSPSKPTSPAPAAPPHADRSSARCGPRPQPWNTS